MRRILFCLLAMFIITCSCFSQVFSPQLAGHSGVRVIYYHYGYYQGNVENGVANGLGTFYFRDGTFFHGNFSNGWWHGKGVIVSPYYGFMSGCWSNGSYIGACPSYNRYDNADEIEEIISEVQYERPDDSRYTAISPEGYKITRIDSETQMGKTLLGKYTGN